jgi:4-aminobutyrate aminotransferase-like enzyme
MPTSSATRRTLDLLRRYESRNITFLEPDGSWPIVWEKARGVHVWDAEGRRYLDMTAAFGVAAAGHANPSVVRAGQRQMSRLLHAMGDVHPHSLKAELACELSRITFGRWKGRGGESPHGKTIFCNSGFEAVEAALKTARRATGKPDIIAFEGAYHGLGYGALNATHRSHFRDSFLDQLREFGHFAPFPDADAPWSLATLEQQLRQLFRRHKVGAVLVEPIQVRGGIRIPPPGFLPLLRGLCDEFSALLVLDEIYTGFGRTGKWFACEHSSTIPDIICLGKALTGGFPLSACVGRADIMDAGWPASEGEAIHTSTFLGHPVGCAMTLAQLREIGRLKLVSRSAALGRFLLARLASLRLPAGDLQLSARGQGLIAALELRHPNGSPATTEALGAIKALLHRGYIFLPEGEHSNVIGFTPPLTITRSQLAAAASALKDVLGAARRPRI